MKLASAEEFLNSILQHDEYSLVFDSEDDAARFRQRCYVFRTRKREHNAKLYANSPKYTPNTPWDGIAFDLDFEAKFGYWVLTGRQTDFTLQHTLHGTPAQMQEYFRRLAAGETIEQIMAERMDRGEDKG